MADLNPPEKRPRRPGLWPAAIIAAFITLVLFGVTVLAAEIYTDNAGPVVDLVSVAVVALVLTGVVMLFPAKTRVWGSGILLGFGIAIGLVLVVFAGVCVTLLVDTAGA